MRQIGNEKRTQYWGYFFVAPFVIIFLIFTLYPTLYTFTLAFTDLQGLRSDFKFVGFKQFTTLIKDHYFWNAIGNTFIIWGWNFVPQLGLALILSVWLSDVRLNLKCKPLFRAVIYMPNLLMTASVSLLFRSLFGFPAGPLSRLFYMNGMGLVDIVQRSGQDVVQMFNFFRSVPFSRGIVAFIQWWMWYGQTVILMMAGITSISPSLYESALVDGANSRQTTWHITLPLLRPMMLYTLVTSMIGGMQMLDIPLLLTDGRGAPDYKIRTTAVYLYNQAFQGRNNYAYAAAISIGMFIITIILALFIFFFMQDRSELTKKGVR
ncbi:MAG: sugar ABC transporter permease [Treponema sp.]|jgi:multiple sugar transport system permease protein|nr:sugar ABC transporter permease [Treponema sp.]